MNYRYSKSVLKYARIYILLVFLLSFSFFYNNLEAREYVVEEYAIGADLSFLKMAEEQGVVFKDIDGKEKSGLKIFKDHGYNWIRLRLFHTPTQLPNNLEYTISLAKEAKKLGFKFLLDYHYSDTWADPGHQWIPKAWEGLIHSDLVDSVFEYTKSTTTSFREAGVLPDMVQIGNEVSNGMIWPDGKLPDNWDNFIDLTKAGIKGVMAGKGNLEPPLIMIQIDKGGDKKATKWFLDKINSYDVEYDVIGQSYYPWWHGTLNDLWENINFMVHEYEKDIILVEAAYHWKPSRYTDKEGPFPETPEGQKEFLEELNRLALMSPEFKVRGVFWWEPAVAGNMRGIGSRGFFDENGKALPVITVFDKYTRY
jgi:arabinogalactan endo-1,4-beta-galactosidase